VTDAGRHALWNPSRFTGITDYQTWEDAPLDDDDITGHVRAGKLAPINIGGDGTFTIHLIDWDSGPSARDTHGKPKSWALPDFVVLISVGLKCPQLGLDVGWSRCT
jgi:hypothetical protein